MSMEHALAKLRQEAVDEVNLFYVKPNPNSKYHVFYMGETPMRCRCGSYGLTHVDTVEGKPVRVSIGRLLIRITATLSPDDKVAKECLRRHEREMDKRTQAKKEKLQGELRRLGDELIESVKEQIFMYVLTLDTDTMGRFVEALANVMDSEVMRVLRKQKPEELEALLKSIGGEEA